MNNVFYLRGGIAKTSSLKEKLINIFFQTSFLVVVFGVYYRACTKTSPIAHTSPSTTFGEKQRMIRLRDHFVPLMVHCALHVRSSNKASNAAIFVVIHTGLAQEIRYPHPLLPQKTLPKSYAFLPTSYSDQQNFLGQLRKKCKTISSIYIEKAE